MFIGEFKHTLDSKGRLALPAKFRANFADGAVVTRGLDNCLFIFTKKDWQELADKLVKLPLAQANSRAFSRLMLAGAVDAELDSQGRTLIPGYLRSYANLKNKVIIAGLYSRLEVWDEDVWKVYKEKTEKESGNIAEKLSELGI